MTVTPSERELERLLAEAEARADAAERRTDRLLHTSEAKYRRLFDTMGHGYGECEMIRDADGRAIDYRLIALNPAYKRLLGLTVEEAEGRTARELFPGVQDWWVETFDDIVRKGEPRVIEYEFAPVGRWYQINAYPQDGDRLIALFEDITDRKNAERARQEAAERTQSEAALTADLAATTLLRDLADRLVTEENSRTIHEEILAAAITITASDAGTIQVFDSETKSLVLLVTKGFDRTMTDHFHRVDANSRTACGIALRTGKRTFIDFDDPTDEACIMHVNAGYRSAQATPLVSRSGVPLGMLNTHWHKDHHRPTEKQLHFLDLLARQAADLIERKAAEAALRDSEARLGKLLTLLPTAVYACDAQGRLTFFNQRAVECWGREPKLGAFEDRWCGSLRMWLPNGEPLPHDDCPMVDAAKQGKSFRDVEVVIEQPSGARILASVNIDPLYDADGQLAGAINAFEDVTERRRAEERLKESEERLRQFGQASSDVLWIRDTKTLNWEYLSPAFETIYGASREEALSGEGLRNWAELIVEDDREHAIASIKRVGAGESVRFEYRIQRPDGEIRWLRNTDFPMLGPSGAVERIGGIGQDITEQKAAADGMEVMVTELQHRTRNLIAVVRSIFGQTIKENQSLGDFEESFAERLAALARVQGLLSQADQNRITLGALLRVELDALGAQEMAERLTLEGPEVSLRNSVVQTLALALHELATNARKYGALAVDRGRLDITWTVQPDARGRRRLSLDWRETGVEPEMSRNVNVAERGGYGRELIEKALPYALGAKTSYRLNGEGVHCTIDLPLERRPN